MSQKDKKTRLVIINIPDEKVAELEKFLKDSKKKDQLALVAKCSKSTIDVISKKKVATFKANRYEVIVCGDNRKAKVFINSLFENKLIPDGKQWTVHGPISERFISEFSVSKFIKK